MNIKLTRHFEIVGRQCGGTNQLETGMEVSALLSINGGGAAEKRRAILIIL